MSLDTCGTVTMCRYPRYDCSYYRLLWDNVLLTWLGCLLLPNGLQHRDDTVGLHGGEHPVFGLIDVGHIDPQAAVFT